MADALLKQWVTSKENEAMPDKALQPTGLPPLCGSRPAAEFERQPGWPRSPPMTMTQLWLRIPALLRAVVVGLAVGLLGTMSWYSPRSLRMAAWE